MSLNLTPGFPSRSSSRTSTPAFSSALTTEVRPPARTFASSASRNLEHDDGDVEVEISAGHRMPSLIVALLDGGGDDARDADAVAAHHHHLRLLLLFVEVLGT